VSEFPGIGIEPYFENEHAVIYCGDSLELLPLFADLSVDHVITDPPYSSHVHSNHKTNDGSEGGANKDLGFASITSETMTFVADQVGRLARRWSLVFSDVESTHLWREAVQQRLEYIRTGFWVKTNPTPQITGDRPGSSVEAITIAHPKGRKAWNSGGKGNVWTHPVSQKRQGRVHPTEKPLPLMAELVASFTSPGDIILDPFGGAGSTARAAVTLGRRVILIEMNEQWCAEAASRMGGQIPDRGNQSALVW
jgi:site-specific DNA-methyltransferase (adenine-specific)